MDLIIFAIFGFIGDLDFTGETDFGETIKQ